MEDKETLEKLKEEVLNGGEYPTTKQIETYMSLVDIYFKSWDIVSKEEAFRNINSLFGISQVVNYVSDIKNYNADYYIMDGYDCLQDVTKSNFIDRIDDLINEICE